MPGEGVVRSRLETGVIVLQVEDIKARRLHVPGSAMMRDAAEQSTHRSGTDISSVRTIVKPWLERKLSTSEMFEMREPTWGDLLQKSLRGFDSSTLL